MTSTETQIRAVSDAPFAMTPHLLRMLRERPVGVQRILRRTDTGELRAFLDPTAADQGFWTALPVWRSAEWRYDDSRWLASTGSLSSPENLVDNLGWFDVPIVWAITETPYFAELLAARSDDTVLVMGDPRDGELRCYKERNWDEYPAQSGWQAWPTVRDPLNRSYGPDLNWLTHNFGTVSLQQVKDAGFIKVWEKAEENPILVEVNPEVNRLQLRITDLESTLATLRTQNQTQQRRLEQMSNDHERFKELVSSTATKYARRHDWCSVVDEALEEMGLEREPVSFSGVISVRINFTANRTDGERGTPNARDVNRWLYGEDDVREAIGENLSLDEDYAGDFEIDSYSFEVISTS